MSKKTNYTATHELTGKVYTRSTARTYTHMVLKRISISAQRADVETCIRRERTINMKYFRELASGVHKLAQQYPAQFSPERIAADVEAAKVWMAVDVEQSVIEGLAEFDAKAHIVEARAAGRDFYFIDNGWCGSLALAQKAAKIGDVILEATAK